MLRKFLGAVLVAASCAVPVPAAQAAPSAAVLELDVTINCFGCGATSGTASGTVVAGDGAFHTGAGVNGSFSTFEDPATCPVGGSASGTLTTSDGYSVAFTWARLGEVLAVSYSDGASGSGTFRIVSPLGNPCGQHHVRAQVVLSHAGDTTPLPAARGHITIHRFPRSTGLGDVRLWVAPVTQDGRPWQCTDVNTGAAVSQGSQLSWPDPGVSCLPPVQYAVRCGRVDAGGYHADAGLGSVTVTSACGSLSVSADIRVPMSWVTVSRSARGNGVVPWTCRITESLRNPVETDYWTFCDANLP